MSRWLASHRLTAWKGLVVIMKAIASHNGLKAAARAFELLRSGASPLDACVEGVTLIEDDPEELTVGYGGLPNEDGVVELDAAVMDGRLHRGGGVAALQRVRHAAKVARLVMQRTKRVLLAGEGALRFALANGFAEEDLLTERSRRMWLHWKRSRSRHDDWIEPAEDEQELDVQRWFEKHFYGLSAPEGAQLKSASSTGPPESTGTVHCAAINAHGDIACATSTSGHAFKIAGRIGDSPILGAGLYCDSEWGSCGSIGNGEANLENLSSFAAVELMRGGMVPAKAGLEILRRITHKSPADQCDEQGRPQFNVQFFLLGQDGTHAGTSMWSRKQIAVADELGARLENCTPLFEKTT